MKIRSYKEAGIAIYRDSSGNMYKFSFFLILCVVYIQKYNPCFELRGYIFIQRHVDTDIIFVL